MIGLKNKIYTIAYDIGTTGVKTCLFEINKKITLIASSSAGYNLYILENGGAEQDPDEWWAAMCKTTADVIKKSKVDNDNISGISFCSQMQGLVLVDNTGKPVHRAMSYMDQRATKELKEGIAYGVQIAGANVPKLLKSLKITGAVAASVKDPVWKYNWVKNNEPEAFKKVYKWLDVKEYLICKMTNEFVMTPDSAFATLLYDIRKGSEGWSKEMCDMLGVEYSHLAQIKPCTSKVGELSAEAAKEIGLAQGTPVFGGGGDASLVGVGAGAVSPNDTHIYWGTSGWVSTVVEKSIVDTSAMIAAIVGADYGRFNYFAELETAGKCYEWLKNNVILDSVEAYNKKSENENLFKYMDKAAANVPVGSNGLIFTPWLHGNRCPFEDPNARGMFFNLSLETTKSDLIRAVLEGVCYHLRWFLETHEKKVSTSKTLRFVGGGAISDVTSQILADCTGRTVETVKSPQNVGALGAAVITAIGLGFAENIENSKKLIEIDKTFKPNLNNKVIYDKMFNVYKSIYQTNKNIFEELNSK